MDRETAQFRKGAGCEQCGGTGFSARTALAELLTVDQVFRDAVMQKLPTRTLLEVAITQGMKTMWRRGLQSVVAGITTLEEVLRVVAVDES
jgi:general secretion pathway protein E